MKNIFSIYILLAIMVLFTFSCGGDNGEPEVIDIPSMDEANCKDPLPSDAIKMCVDRLKSIDSSSSRLKAVLLTEKKWKVGHTIVVKFMNGSDFLHEEVKKYAEIWLQHANLKFEYVGPNDYADIKVAFFWDCDGTTWSLVGTDCTKTRQNQPTMNFGWLKDDTSPVEIRRVVLHEFGHALGLVHEHQHPENPIQWDEEEVYKYYGEVNGWDKRAVYENILSKYDTTRTTYSDYDEKSIMMYAIDPKLTKNNYRVPWNNDLSPMDIEFISEMYPFSEQEGVD